MTGNRRAGPWPAVLVLDGGTDAALSAAQAYGARVTVHTAGPARCRAFDSRYTAKRLPLSAEIADEALIESLRAWNAETDYSLILPCSEQTVDALKTLPSGDLLRQKILLPPAASIDIAFDTERLLPLARRPGINTPIQRFTRSWEGAMPPTDPFADMHYPVRLELARRPLRHRARRLKLPARHAKDAARAEAYLEDFLKHGTIAVSEWQAGETWDLLCVCRTGEVLRHTACRWLHGGELEDGSYGEIADTPQELLAGVKCLLAEIEWHGPASLRFRRRAGGHFELMQLSPVFGAALELDCRAGAQLLDALLAVAKRHDPGPTRRVQAALRCRFVARDIDWIRMASEEGRAWHEWLRVLGRKEVWAHARWRDAGPTLRQAGDLFQRIAGRALARPTRALDLAAMRRLHQRNLKRLSQHRPAKGTLMFVCHGNICRSAFAEQVAHAHVPEWTVNSSGLGADDGAQTPGRIQRISASLGHRLEAHRSRAITRELLAAADIVLIMDRSNYRLLKRNYPQYLHKSLMLGAFAGPGELEIPDPVDQSPQDALASLTHTLRATEGLMRWLRA